MVAFFLSPWPVSARSPRARRARGGAAPCGESARIESRPGNKVEDSMSKVKSAKQKKELSLKLDRRNAIGTTPHPGRKDVALEKQRSHQRERRVVHQILDSVGPHPGEDEATAMQHDLKVKSRAKQLKGFKKPPDVPLAKVIEHKLARRKRTDDKPS
jgi:hypothetical protein